MTTLKLILIFLSFALYSCGQNTTKPKRDPALALLTNKIIPLVNHLDNSDSCKKALLYLDSATAIDSNCFLCYYNKLMFLASLKKYDQAILAINNCIRLSPNAHDLYLTGGMLYEQAGDTISSMKYFNKSLAISNAVLDTMSKKNRDFVMLTTNQAISLVMLNDSAKANTILKNLYDTQPDDPEYNNVEKKYILSLMNKNKRGLIEFIYDPVKHSR